MSSFWKGKKVLVTGHTGFKGSWLSLWLQKLGAKVVGYALPPPTEPSLFEVARVGEGMTSIEGDVRDLRSLEGTIAAHRPEIVIHMAAQAIVRAGYEDPVETYSTNVLGTVNLLEAIRTTPSARVVVAVTSDKCYENLEIERGYREAHDALGGRDPYSSSKACAELVARSYRDSFLAAADPPVAVGTARAGNVIGGGDWARDRLVPDLMRALLARRRLYIRYPEAVRPWQHVLDPVGGYLRLAECLWQGGDRFSEAWNFAPDDDKLLSVREIVHLIQELWDDPVEVELAPGPHPHEHTLLRLDPGKARSKLDWAPRLATPRALRWVVEWFRGYREDRDMRELTASQIERYQSLAAMRAA